jgi:hypothetical protein
MKDTVYLKKKIYTKYEFSVKRYWQLQLGIYKNS